MNSEETKTAQNQDSIPVGPIVAGAIYDFAAWLTTRPGLMRVGAMHNAAPMAEAVGVFLRAKFVEGDPRVMDWESALAGVIVERLAPGEVLPGTPVEGVPDRGPQVCAGLGLDDLTLELSPSELDEAPK